MERRDDGNYKSPGLCGGTLVASKYVISAAHCMYNYNTDVEAISNKDPQDLVIIIGDHILFDDTDATPLPTRIINVRSYTNHPDYRQQFGIQPVIEDGYDITILELEEELDMTIYTPACLAESDDYTFFDGKTATVAGWGDLSEDGPMPDPLVPHSVDLRVIGANDCKWSRKWAPFQPSQQEQRAPFHKAPRGFYHIRSIMCAGFPEGGKDACKVRFWVSSFLIFKQKT